MKANRRRRRAGFTLIEVLLVLVILVILASIVVVNYANVQDSAYEDAARTQVHAFEVPLGLYRLHLGTYPQGNEGLNALREAPSDLTNPEKWEGPYLEKNVPLDPWGNEYVYEVPGRYADEGKPDIYSMGPDGMEGTDDDIGNWMIEEQ